MFQKIILLFDSADRKRLVWVFLTMLVASFLEMTGIGLIFPILKVASDPEGLKDYAFYDWFISLTGPLAQGDLLIASMLALLGFYVFKGGYLLVQRHLFYKFLYSRQVKLSTTLFDRYLHMPYRFHLDQNSASLLRTANEEVLQVFQFLLVPLSTLLIEMALIVLLMMVLVAVEPLGSLVVFVLIGCSSALFLKVLRKRSYALGQDRYVYSREMVKWVQQAIFGIKESKVLGREPYFMRAYLHSADAFAESARRQSLYGAAALPFIEFMGIASIVLMTSIMLWSGDSVEAVLPTLGLFGVAAARLMPSANRMIISLTSIRGHSRLLDNLVHEINAYGVFKPEELAAPPTPTAPSPTAGDVTTVDWQTLQIQGLTFWYKESTPILKGLTLALHRGEMVGFVGSSGSGKSTLVHLLLGLLEPHEGAFVVDGAPTDLTQPRWQRQFGFISQSTYLCDDTVRRNVAFGLGDEEIDDARVWQVLTIANIADHVRQMERGLDTLVGEGGIKLSGGQKQRLGIARALYGEPEVLVMDEATSSLDNQTEREISESIEALSQRKTLWIVAHRLTTVQNCDRIVFLDQGQVLAQGTYAQLVERCEPFRALVYAWEKSEGALGGAGAQRS